MRRRQEKRLEGEVTGWGDLLYIDKDGRLDC